MSQAAALASPVVETTLGKVRGISGGGVQIFLGMPYAAAPRRFEPPQAAEPWAGVRDATAYGASSPQVRRWKPERGPPPWVDAVGVPTSEDCLFINVWTPSADGRKRPVLVWVHTGGFGAGSGSAPMFEGDRLAAGNDVVLVSLNHRLGSLGYLQLEHLEPSFKGSANVGMLDIVAALEWIRDNIAAFGGDPGSVTLFGESGGGLKICTLMAMPRAEGLFHKAAVQSGGRVRHLDAERSRQVTRRVLENLGLTERDAARLRDVPIDALVEAASKAGQAFGGGGPGFPHAFTPMVDGGIVPVDPFHESSPEWARNVPLLTGYNRTEATYFARMGYGENDPALTRDEAVRRLAKVAGDNAEPVFEAFEADAPGRSVFDTYIAAFTEYPTGAFARHLAHLRARDGHGPTYLYRFDWMGSVWRNTPGAPHMIELPFVFDAPDRAPDWLDDGPQTATLAHRVGAAWCAFARNGRPDTADMPDWPEYRLDDRRLMSIDTHAQAAPDLGAGPRRALQRALRLEEF